MQLTSIEFLFGFLPITLLLYEALRRLKARQQILDLLLVAASLIFYAFGSLKSLFILLFILLWNYVCAASFSSEKYASTEQERRIYLWICVGVNLLVLFVYKYLIVWLGGLLAPLGLSDLSQSLAMPVGLSFYMFSSLSYVFDIYNGKEKPCTLLEFGIFAGFFAWVNMGPIQHYARMREQLNRHVITLAGRRAGAALFLQGLAYKVILADNLALVFQTTSPNTTWLGNLLFGFSYFFQLYFDFCGYSRMARGLAAFFGFEVPKNFEAPYQALSVQDFWRRWHISLTDWFRQYVYIPLGGNRVSQKRWILNVLIVWLLTGVWHGAQLTFLVWGLYQGCLILLERFVLNRYLERCPLGVRHLYLILTQLVGWTFFSAVSLPAAAGTIGRYFGVGISGFADMTALFALRQSLILFLVAILCCSSLPAFLAQWLRNKSRKAWPLLNVLGYGSTFLVCLAMLISQTAQTFLYAAF